MSKLVQKEFLNLLTGKLVKGPFREASPEELEGYQLSDSMKRDMEPYPKNYTMRIIYERQAS